jgi:hypothetical protein
VDGYRISLMEINIDNRVFLAHVGRKLSIHQRPQTGRRPQCSTTAPLRRPALITSRRLITVATRCSAAAAFGLLARRGRASKATSSGESVGTG